MKKGFGSGDENLGRVDSARLSGRFLGPKQETLAKADESSSGSNKQRKNRRE